MQQLVACRKRAFSNTKPVVTVDHVETTRITQLIPTTSAQTPTTTRELPRDVPTVSTVVSTHDFEETTEATTQHRTETPSSSVRVKITETPLRTTTTAHQEKTTSQYGPINIALGENLYTNQYPPFIS